MTPLDYPPSFLNLISHLKTLPTIGPKSAERLALWLMTQHSTAAHDLATALEQAQNQLHSCPQCGFFTEDTLCDACLDSQRDQTKLCVVEQASDVLPIEHCGAYKGLYHCLGGKLSPLNNVEPEDLRIDSLLERIKKTPGVEIILALSSDVEGEATALYLSQILHPYDCTITRLAQGLPAGTGLGYADTLTLSRAFSGRQQMSETTS